MKEKSIKGITLVALVVTIIILLILAGVAITALTQTGLFENAKQAKNAMENAQNTENITLIDYNNKIEQIIGSREDVPITQKQYEELLSRISSLESKLNEDSRTSSVFIDTTKCIENICNVQNQWENSADYKYTATQDCVVTGWVGSYGNGTGTPSNDVGIDFLLNSVSIMHVFELYTCSTQFPINGIYLKKGDILNVKLLTGNFKGVLNVYALK